MFKKCLHNKDKHSFVLIPSKHFFAWCEALCEGTRCPPLRASLYGWRLKMRRCPAHPPSSTKRIMSSYFNPLGRVIFAHAQFLFFNMSSRFGSALDYMFRKMGRNESTHLLLRITSRTEKLRIRK